MGDFFLRSRCPVLAETFLRSRLEYSVERVLRALLGEGSRDLVLRKMVGKEDLLFLSFFSVMPFAESSIWTTFPGSEIIIIRIKGNFRKSNTTWDERKLHHKKKLTYLCFKFHVGACKHASMWLWTVFKQNYQTQKILCADQIHTQKNKSMFLFNYFSRQQQNTYPYTSAHKQ